MGSSGEGAAIDVALENRVDDSLHEIVIKHQGKPCGKGVTAVGAIKTVGTTVLLQACLCRGHVLHAVGAVVTVHLVTHAEPAPDVQAVAAEIQLRDGLEAAAAALVPHQLLDTRIKRGPDTRLG